MQIRKNKMDSFNIVDSEIKNIECEIEKMFNMAYFLEETGNFFLSKKFRHSAENLEKSVQNLGKATRNILNEEYKQAQQSSINILNACLAGIKLNEKNP
jgi:hypothetical protein